MVGYNFLNNLRTRWSVDGGNQSDASAVSLHLSPTYDVFRHSLNRSSSVVLELVTLIGLTSLWINGRPTLEPKLNSRKASLVLSKIDEILAWEKNSDRARDANFVELGRHLCEVRAGQYWQLDNLRSFDEFLERKFPESRRKAYYLMAIHEHLPKIPKPDLKLVGWSKATELVKGPEEIEINLTVQPGCTKRQRCPRKSSNERWKNT